MARPDYLDKGLENISQAIGTALCNLHEKKIRERERERKRERERERERESERAGKQRNAQIVKHPSYYVNVNATVCMLDKFNLGKINVSQSVESRDLIKGAFLHS